MDAVSLVAYAIAILIPAFAFYLIFILDFFSTGKRDIAAVCLAWGIFGAFGIAYALSAPFEQEFGFEAAATIAAPMVEEILKALILLYFIAQPRFRYFVDGAVYGFAVGIGFAVSENIFYVASLSGNDALALAVSRVLSASLMHATASAVVGISLGLSRRRSGLVHRLLPAAGLLFAILVHAFYNNLVYHLSGELVILLAAIGIGLGGGVLIAMFIRWGLNIEKRRFADTLGLTVGVTSAERKAVQQLGSNGIETILDELGVIFGKEKIDLIHQLLITEANIGILNNNLRSGGGERLRKAWEAEIMTLREQINYIRAQIGAYPMTLLRSLLPEDHHAVWTDFTGHVAAYAPQQVHSFDLFLIASELAGTLSDDQVEIFSNKLKKISFFKNVTHADLDNLSRAIILRHYSHGEMLFDKGDTGDAMYLIDRGYIDIFTLDDHNKEELLRTFGAGEIIGELALLDGKPRSARARANGPLQVMVLHRDHFMRFIQSRPKVILIVLQFLADRVRHITDIVTGDSLRDTQTRHTAEEFGEFDVAPEATDTIEKRRVDNMGVFGRLSSALDDLEEQASQRKRG